MTNITITHVLEFKKKGVPLKPLILYAKYSVLPTVSIGIYRIELMDNLCSTQSPDRYM